MQIFRLDPIKIIKLDEFAVTEANRDTPAVQLLRVGKFTHPKFGEVEIGPGTLREMVSNFEKNVRRIDLAIDFSHRSEDEAAGWIEELFLSEDGLELWAKVKWTPAGRSALNEKRFRYLSSDFTFAYQDNETLQKYGPVLLGAGLTNRPVVKGMAPAVELSELTKKSKETKMTKEIQLGEAELQKQIDDLKAAMVEMKSKLDGMTVERDALAEDKQKLAGEIKTLSEGKADLEKKAVLDAKATEFATLLSEGKVVPAQKDSFIKGDMAEFLKNAGALNLGEKGSNYTPKYAGAKDPQDEVISLAEKKIQDKACKEIGEAIYMVLSENPKLAEQYNAAVAV